MRVAIPRPRGGRDDADPGMSRAGEPVADGAEIGERHRSHERPDPDTTVQSVEHVRAHRDLRSDETDSRMLRRRDARW
ncbi:hypothetical protein DW322_18710 [Rhodococcus rhodnii]|uniref:Uncharacterized protein n=1 Tax=Rhodococcus rhodnii TaxID=38312 RepID=A0A6P2CJ00_9NOCA|nr:hypothetical protein DW322_18710 [Rhodococcus rhodnii]